MGLRSDETVITGAWVLVDGRVVGDESERRIQEALRLELDPLARRGWESLFRSSMDGRLWVLDYPQSELHGGGPARLTVIPLADAKARFDLQGPPSEHPPPPQPGPGQ